MFIHVVFMFGFQVNGLILCRVWVWVSGTQHESTPHKMYLTRQKLSGLLKNPKWLLQQSWRRAHVEEKNYLVFRTLLN